MGLTLKVDGFDLSSYFQAFEDTADPANPGYLEPLYAGVPALSEGALGVGEGLHNREMVFPLALKGSPVGVDQVNLLVQTIRSHLYRGAQVELKPEGASNSSFFTLEHGQFQPAWKHAHHRLGRVLGSLHLTCRPYADTGTMRLVASQAGTGILTFLATGILGDVPALTNTVIDVGSYSAATYRAVMVSAHPNPSYPAIWFPASGNAPNAPSKVLVGASGALGSQYYACEIATNAIPIAVGSQINLGPAFNGRHRVFGLFRSRVTPASAMAVTLIDANSAAPLGSAIIPTATQAWQLVDLGEVWGSDTTPSPVATNIYQLQVGRTTGAAGTPVGSFHFDYGGMVLLPLDAGAQIAVATGGPANTRQLPRSQWHFQTYPERRTRVVGFNTATVTSEVLGRGGPLKLGPTGSPVASGPYTIVALQGEPGNFVANDIMDAGVFVRERYSFFK